MEFSVITNNVTHIQVFTFTSLVLSIFYTFTNVFYSTYEHVFFYVEKILNLVICVDKIIF